MAEQTPTVNCTTPNKNSNRTGGTAMKKCVICGKETTDELCDDCSFLSETHYLFLCGMCGNTGAVERSETAKMVIINTYHVAAEEIDEVVLICTTGCGKCVVRGNA